MDESERRRLSNSKLTRGPFLDAIPFNHPPRPARANSRLRFETGRSSDWTRESVPLSRPPDRLRRANAKNAFYPTANDDDPWDEIYRPRDTDGIITSSFSLSLSLSLSLSFSRARSLSPFPLLLFTGTTLSNDRQRFCLLRQP